MSFEINACPSEICSGIKLVDSTGYFTVDNPWGYNAPNPTVPSLDPDGTFNYDSYQLQLFYAKPGFYDDNGPPDFTANLLTWPHTVDEDGHVTWEFSFADLGVTELRSGIWLFRLNPVIFNDGSEDIDYSDDVQVFFTDDIQAKIDARAINADFDCGCNDSCEPIWSLNSKLELAKRMGCACQNPEKTQAMVDSLYNSYQRCC
jgi:hypothetical protein